MKRLIYILAMLLMSGACLSSCKTSRNMETEKQVDYSGEFQRLKSMIESLQLDVNKQVNITSEKLSNLKIENKTVDLSPPDLTGKQYPIRETTTSASQNEKERVEVDETLSIILHQFSDRLDSLNNKVAVVLNQHENVVELSWWDLYKDKVYCTVIGLLIIGWLFYRIRKK